jgi:prolyl oligopeptidase PreP (S9A serine peptidase family)
MSKYSPYQNVKAGVRYAPTLLPVDQGRPGSPGHARKMAAKLDAGGSRSTSTNIWKEAIRSAPTAARTRCARRCCGHS